MNHIGTSVVINIRGITGAIFIIKSINVSLAALPIMILGGSPISVAVPPILDARISINRKGYGSILSSSVISSVMGTIRRTVVTLSRKAEKIAVVRESMTRIHQGSPFTSFADFIARY